MCQLYHALFYYCCSLFIIVVRYFVRYWISIHSFAQLLFSFDSFAFDSFIVHCLKEKRFNSDPGLYSRYFDPAVPLNKNTITIYACQ
jgi:hypothetical protein